MNGRNAPDQNMFKLSFFPVALGRAIAVCLLGAVGLGAVGQGAPKALTPQEFGKLIFSTNAFFFHDNLSFYGGRLYAGSREGLFEIENKAFTRLYRWRGENMSVIGLWRDDANNLLWARLGNEHVFSCYDGKAWRTVKLPKPEHGYFTRGDMWLGFRGISNRRTFWLEGAGRVWAWTPKSGKWTEETFPPSFGIARNTPLVKRFIPADEDIYVVIRDEKEPYFLLSEIEEQLGTFDRIKGDSVYYLSKGEWIGITNRGKSFFTVETAVAQNKAYVRAKSGELFEVTKSGISQLKTPGVCEAIAGSPNDGLLASFRELGVFELKDGWRRLLNSPYSQAGGDYEVHMAVNNGQIALAVTPKYIQRRTGDVESNANPRLWISDRFDWREIPPCHQAVENQTP